MKDYSGKTVSANLIDGLRTLTGKIEFQVEGIMFKADSVNGVMRMPIILYSDIKSVEPKNTMGIIPNGIFIEVRENKSYFFVVNDRKNVIAYITEQISLKK